MGSRRTTTRSSRGRFTAVIVQAADAVSAARPGARRETLEGYVKTTGASRGALPSNSKGSKKVFALQAGREVREWWSTLVMSLDDLEARRSYRVSIARKLEEDLQYPGQIQVTVIREFRATDYAR